MDSKKIENETHRYKEQIGSCQRWGWAVNKMGKGQWVQTSS